MSNPCIARWGKGAVVSALGATVCYWTWIFAIEWADGVRDAHREAFLAGFLEGVLARAAGLVAMPVLLWAGMRAVGERGHHLLVMFGTVAWFFIGGHVIEDVISVFGTALWITCFAVLCGVLALAKVPER